MEGRTGIDGVDLARLATASSARRAEPRVRRRWDWRTWLPLLVVAAGALGLAGVYILPMLAPVTEVQAAPVIVAESAVERRASTALQATGWAEPDPFPVRIAPQIPGRVIAMPVIEGTPLVAGETIVARLDTSVIDRELAAAEATARRREATLESLKIDLAQATALAERNLEARLRHAELEDAAADLDREILIAEADLERAEARLAQNADARDHAAESAVNVAAGDARAAELDREIAELEARLPYLRIYAKRQREAFEAAGVNELAAQEAENDVAVAEAKLAQLRLEREAIHRHCEATRRHLAVMEEVVADPADLRTAVDVAQATLDGLEARRETLAARIEIAREEAEDALTLQSEVAKLEQRVIEADAALDEAKAQVALLETRRELHTVISPIDGEVLALEATAGAMVGGDSDVEFICTAFEPSELQVRVDLPLADVPAVAIGQRVEVTSEAVPDRVYDGVVTRFVRQANLARNSLQVKVRINDPDDRLRPDMLTRCRFLPLPRPDNADGDDGAGDDDTGSPTVHRRFVPETAVVQDGEGRAVFLIDPRGLTAGEATARRLSVTVHDNAEAPDGHVEVVGELPIGSSVVLQPPPGLTDGARLQLREH